VLIGSLANPKIFLFNFEKLSKNFWKKSENTF